MEVLYARCAGVDVHKRMLMTHARMIEDRKVRREVKESGTFTREILALADWLKEREITHIAMESTGPYWRPVYNILEGSFQILVCNAQHIKNVPGRKTDVKDAEWIADLLAHGLLQPSFVPDAPQQALRDLTRGRWVLVAERVRIGNRIQKLLEEANIKLASVASDVLGVSGRTMLAAIAAGQDDPKALADMARGRLRHKLDLLGQAMQGRVRPHQRILLRELLNQVRSLDDSIASLETAIDEAIRQETEIPFERAVAVLQSAPGIAANAAPAIISEIGVDMARFGSAPRLCAWAGVAPGNRQSGGKRLSGRTLNGNRALVRTLVEAACSAKSQRGTYLSALYGRIAARRGKKRALMAVAHSLLRSIYYMLLNDVPYVDLGANHFEKLNRDRIVRRCARTLDSLGYDVSQRQPIPA